jgi:sulfate transport system substrate-binding protein
MSTSRWLDIFGLTLAAVAIGAIALKNYEGDMSGKILNVSYDSTRELYKEINPKFVAKYEAETGHRVSVEQSHGGSSRQARAVTEGRPADVVTLALPSDIEMLSKHGLIAGDWKNRLPHNSQPYSSTIVFVVRKPNSKHIKDWQDLIGPDVTIITPDPRTSGNGKLSLLAAWGSVIYRGGSEDQARDFVRNLYQHVPILGQGARDSSTMFALAKEGDVHLTWENEALREVTESKGELEIVYPAVSILAEPSVTWVDANVEKHKSGSAAKAYLEYLFTDAAQEIFARDGYRPINEAVLQKHRNRLPNIRLFPITVVAKDWADAQEKFFGEDGIYATIQSAPTK